MKQKIIFIVAGLALLALFVGGMLAYQNTQNKSATAQAQVNQAALLRMHSPMLGAQTAPVVLVEFLDPACETCSAFYPLVKDIMAKNPDQIRLVLRYAPLHQGSDQVIAALEAARKQGKYWPALEAVLKNQPAWTEHHVAYVDRIWPLWADLGLDLAQLKTDMQSPAIASLIAQDIADGQTLQVNQTPSFFVNGKPLLNFGYEQLNALIETELAAASQGKGIE